GTAGRGGVFGGDVDFDGLRGAPAAIPRDEGPDRLSGPRLRQRHGCAHRASGRSRRGTWSSGGFMMRSGARRWCCGESSDLLRWETAKEMSARGPRAEVVEIAGVGHAPTLIREEQIRVVRKFLHAREYFADPSP